MATPVNHEEYRDFIGQIELEAIWLVSCAIRNSAGSSTPRNASVSVEDAYRWETSKAGFHCFATYRLGVEVGDTQVAALEVEFGLGFKSELQMTEATFATFSKVNLPVNSWPYLREFVSTTFGRFGWNPFTLPALKRNVAQKKAPKTE